MPSRSVDRERPTETVLVGRVLRAHGIRGEVKVEVQSDVADRFVRGAELLLTRPGATHPERASIAALRPQDRTLLVHFAGCDDRTGAEALRGARLEVEKSRVPPPPPDAYYHFDLAGCRCFDVVAGDLGVVADVIEDGGGELLVVENEGRTLLLPFVRAYLRKVDIAAQRIDFDLPAGLIETCTSGS